MYVIQIANDRVALHVGHGAVGEAETPTRMGGSNGDRRLETETCARAVPLGRQAVLADVRAAGHRDSAVAFPQLYTRNFPSFRKTKHSRSHWCECRRAPTGPVGNEFRSFTHVSCRRYVDSYSTPKRRPARDWRRLKNERSRPGSTARPRVSSSRSVGPFRADGSGFGAAGSGGSAALAGLYLLVN